MEDPTNPTNSGPTDFIQKLFRMINDPSSNSLTHWSQAGDTFLILDPHDFAKLLLPRHFKHNNFQSFIRQLNKYGFSKVKRTHTEEKLWEFKHDNFNRNGFENLKEIKRKAAATRRVSVNALENGGFDNFCDSPPFASNGLSQNAEALLKAYMEKVDRLEKQTLASNPETQAKFEKLMTEVSNIQKTMQAQDGLMQTIIQCIVSQEKALMLFVDNQWRQDFNPPVGQVQPVVPQPPHFSANIQKLVNSYKQVSKASGEFLNSFTQAAQEFIPAAPIINQDSLSTESNGNTEFHGFSVQPFVGKSDPSTNLVSSTFSYPNQSHPHMVNNTQINASSNSFNGSQNLPNGQIGMHSISSHPNCNNSQNNQHIPNQTLSNNVSNGFQSQLQCPQTMLQNNPQNGVQVGQQVSAQNVAAMTQQGQIVNQLPSHNHTGIQKNIRKISQNSTQSSTPTQSNSQIKRPLVTPPTAKMSAYKKKPKTDADPLPWTWTVPPNVLLVDDDPTCQAIYARSLQILGCSYEIAADGAEAVKKMQSRKYDMVLMDIWMPEMDGLSATKRIREFDNATPIIAITGDYREADRDFYLEQGINEVLGKPLKVGELGPIMQKHWLKFCIKRDAEPQSQVSNDTIQFSFQSIPNQNTPFSSGIIPSYYQQPPASH